MAVGKSAAMPNAKYTVRITDGTNTVGFITASRTGVRRLPRGAGAERKVIRQTTWTGGRGNERFATDTTKFFDDGNLWTTVDGQVCNGPLALFADGQGSVSPLFKQVMTQPAAGVRLAFTPVGVTTVLRRLLTATSTFTAATVEVYARKVGTPTSDLLVRVYANNAGALGTLMGTATLTAGSISALSQWSELPITLTGNITSGQGYWVVVLASAPAASSGDNYWSVLTPYATNTPFARLAESKTTFKSVKFFEYKRGLYALVMRHNAAASLLMNGDRGVCTGTQATTTIVDSTKSWATNQWVGCSVYITAGPNKGESRLIASNTATTLTLSGAAWPLTPTTGATGTEYVIVGSLVWTDASYATALSSSTLTQYATDVEVFGDTVYVAQGDLAASPALVRMREYNNAGVWTRQFAADGTNKASLLRASTHHTSGVPVLYRAMQLAGTVSCAPKVTWGTNLTFESDIDCGARTSLITGLVDYNNQLYASQEENLWSLKDGTFARVPITLDRARDERNGVAMAWWNTQLFFSFLSGLERLYGSTVDDIGPDRGTGMPSFRRGKIVDLVPVANHLYVSYASTVCSSVMVTTDPGGDWHTLYVHPRSGEVTSGIYYQTIPGQANRIWFTAGANLMCLIMPDELHNPINDSNMLYSPHGYLVTSWFDADSPELDHYFDQLRFSTRNANVTNSIEIEYQLDDADYNTAAWQKFALSDRSVYQSPYLKVNVNGDNGRNVTGRRIRFRLHFICDGLTPMIMNALEMRLVQMNEVLYDYIMDITLKDRIMLMNGQDAVERVMTPVQILESWKEDATPLTFSFVGPSGGEIFDDTRGHIDPVSLLAQEWNDSDTALTGNIMFKTLPD